MTGFEIKKMNLDQIDLTDETFRYRATIAVDGLAESIAEHGLQTPVVLRPNGNGSYQLISGFRRIAAIRQLQLQGLWNDAPIPAIIRDDLANDIEAAKSSVIENQARATYTDLDRAHAILNLRNLGLPDAEIQSTFGIGQRQLQRLLQLLALPAPLHAAVAADQIKPTLAIRLMQHLRHYPTTDLDHWLAWIIDNNATLSQLSTALRHEAAAFDSKSPPTLATFNTDSPTPFVTTRALRIDHTLTPTQRKAVLDQLTALISFIKKL